MRRIFGTIALTFGIGLASVGASAETGGWGYELGNELMSPFCPGRALSECPSPNASDLRQWILDQEAAGRSREEVEAQLYERWGDQLRQAPKLEGVGLIAYAVPAGATLAGAAVVGFFLRRRRGEQGSPATVPEAPAAPVEDPELQRLIDEELRDDR